jgi:hypothetical protein
LNGCYQFWNVLEVTSSFSLDGNCILFCHGLAQKI